MFSVVRHNDSTDGRIIDFFFKYTLLQELEAYIII